MKRNKNRIGMCRWLLMAVFFACNFGLMTASASGQDFSGLEEGHACGTEHSINGVLYKVRCENSDFTLHQVNDGFVARIQGHARYVNGTTSYGWPGIDADMRGHFIDTSCCEGRGIEVFGEGASYQHTSYDMIIRNGIFLSKNGVFALGKHLRDKESEFGDRFEQSDYDQCGVKYTIQDIYNRIVERWYRNIHLINMTLQGERGEVMADNSSVDASRLFMTGVDVTGVDFSFRRNQFVLRSSRQSLAPQPEVTQITSLSSTYLGNMPGIDAYHPHSAVYLSCADNATIDGNTFTAKTKEKGAFAIVLKHSRNVRITNNTFEGFDVPILMDKYSSIINDKGNVIKPDVTLSSPESKLYGKGLDKPPVSPYKPWWKFWQ